MLACATANAEVAKEAGVDKADILQPFLQRLKVLADVGDLFEPESVSQILAMNFQLKRSESVLDCSQVWQTRSTQTIRSTPDASSWYRNLPSGVRNMPVQAAFINPAMTVGDAVFSYEVERTIACTDRFNLQDHTKAYLSFDGLPSFACISAVDIQQQLPEAKFVMATDGVSLYAYQGRLDDEAGASLQFVFRMGAPCALSATIRKDQQDGLRYARADSSRRHCEIHSDRAFCMKHQPFGWGDGAAIDEMSQYADQICGTTDSLYRHDTEHGTQPAPVPGYKHGAPPCQRHDN